MFLKCETLFLRTRWAICLNNAMKEIESKLATIEWPFLTIHGEKDTLVKPIASEKLHAQSSSADKTMTVNILCIYGIS